MRASLGRVMVRLLVVQPSDTDPPERLGDWLINAGADLTVCRPATDGAPDNLDGVDGVVCMGGVMGAHDDADHPWLAALRWLLADAVARRLPVLGICLGGQLLAAATGGAVRRAVDGPEAGTLLVAKRDAAAHDPLFAPLPLTPDVIQFHHDEIHRLPPGATLLASSPRHANQAFRVGTAGYGLQFHIETSPATVLSWARRDTAGAAAFPPGQLDPAHLEQVHADIAEAWQPLAVRFVALAAGELAPAVESEDRSVLPLLGP
ncbi:MAG: type 1 glutamine amidotransferase [Actinomycetota bacterium]|nr:type 1 glutamine amidotransferase [Actinomycetota bacterium]